MKYSLTLALSVLIFTGVAQANVMSMGSKVIEGGEGSPAAVKWNEILPKAEIVEGDDSVSSTTISLNKITCTLYSSQVGSDKATGGTTYRCETLN